MTAWEPATYRIAYQRGTGIGAMRLPNETATGERLGPFGVAHMHTTAGGRIWAVTHLATGRWIPPAFETKDQAKTYAEALIPLRNDWNEIKEGQVFGRGFIREVHGIARRIMQAGMRGAA